MSDLPVCWTTAPGKATCVVKLPPPVYPWHLGVACFGLLALVLLVSWWRTRVGSSAWKPSPSSP